MSTVLVSGGFDNIQSRHVRFLEEAAKWGDVHVALWSDASFAAIEGRPPRFPGRERSYLLQSLRLVEHVTLVDGKIDPDAVPEIAGIRAPTWAVSEEHDNSRKRELAQAHGIPYRVIQNASLVGFPAPPRTSPDFKSARKRVMVTGCFDWFHSGHVRFFEEASTRGDLYVIVGHDANIRLLKGEGHPMFPQAERFYMVQAVRYVHQAMISTGHGWLDAAPEIALVKPHIYVVNEDGDKPEKREFCAARGVEYVVLKRTPKEGLPRREGTLLRAR